MSKERMTSEPHDPNTIAAYIEGRLDQLEESRFLAHAAECAECREVIAAFARASAAERPPTVLPSHAGASPWRRPWLMPAAAALLVGVSAWMLAVQYGSRSATPGAITPRADIHLPTRPVEAPGSPAPPTRGGADGPIPQPEDLQRKRSGERRIGRKVFRLIAGEWVDESYDPLDVLPVVTARTPSDRTSLLDRVPALRPYAGLGERVVVVHGGTVYRFDPSPIR